MNRKHSDKYKLLGLNISYYRKSQNLTQEDLAEMVDISRTHLASIEAMNVDKAPSMDLFFDIADALGIEPEKLLEKK